MNPLKLKLHSLRSHSKQLETDYLSSIFDYVGRKGILSSSGRSRGTTQSKSTERRLDTTESPSPRNKKVQERWMSIVKKKIQF